MIDQEKTGFESTRQVMNALKLLNSPYLPTNQRYAHRMISVLRELHASVVDDTGSQTGFKKRGQLLI